MEFLEKIGDFFIQLTAAIERFVTNLFGASNERQMRKLGFVRKGTETTITPGSLLDRINQQEAAWQKLTDDELKQTATRYRARLAEGEKLDQILPEVFAATREAGRRYLKMRHYDVQMIGGYILHNGNIAEMVTGEGKTLVATLPAVLNALAGKVHVVTVNDYLARRDMEWMAPLYMGLGLTVGAIQSHQPLEDKVHAYGCDITYGTNSEFGFDYLRDNMKPTKDAQVQGPLIYAIVDEIDNILIDEARTPLIISGPAHDDIDKYKKANEVALKLKPGEHFEIQEKERTCHLTEEGIRVAEQLAGVESFYTAGNMEWPHLLDNALKAHHLYKRDVDYVSMDGEIIIVDEFTGRLMKGRQWSDGLHQAVEAKERVKIKEENQTLATITLQNYFKLYKKLSGMTGTAMTEATEFWKIYHLDVIAVPTNRPMKRINHPDVIFMTEEEKYEAIVKELEEVHQTGRPILVGTTSIEKSEFLSGRLGRMGIEHEVLNAKQHEREADIIAQAGRLKAVTIATNMAGRGTDIILGGNSEHMAWEVLKHTYPSRLDVPKPEWDALARKIAEEEGLVAEGRQVAELGGLHVIGTERHEARRIDLQLRGRSGRQGDPGSSRFFLALNDTLMRRFAPEWMQRFLVNFGGWEKGDCIESPMVSRQIERAQKRVEEYNFEIRKNLLEYDEVMDQQRKRVYSFRQHILDGGNCREAIRQMMLDQVQEAVDSMLSLSYGRETVSQWLASEYGIEIDAKDLRGMEAGQAQAYIHDEAVRQMIEQLRDRIDEDLPAEVDDERDWNWGSLSKWVNSRWNLNTNDRELKKVGRPDLHEHLVERAGESIDKMDLTPLETYLGDNWGRQALCAWLERQFTLQLPAEKFAHLDPEQVTELIMSELDRMYQEKEVQFPVAVGMSQFLSETGEYGAAKYNQEGLVNWANSRFQSRLGLEDIKGKPRDEVQELLAGYSRSFYANGESVNRLETYLDQAYGERNGSGSRHAPATARQTAPLQELVQWAQQDLHASIQVDELLPLSREDARQKLLEAVETRYRPELREAERALLLEVLDTYWKDHLYFMDHLRQGIGLVGYAQKDPKVEYKREGMKAFDAMWKRIADDVNRSIFRLEQMSPGFVGSLWQITSTTHESPAGLDMLIAGGDGASADGEQLQTNASQEEAPLEPIRNRGERVGRNDPCPCGSGKKFKNCCMQKLRT